MLATGNTKRLKMLAFPPSNPTSTATCPMTLALVLSNRIKGIARLRPDLKTIGPLGVVRKHPLSDCRNRSFDYCFRTHTVLIRDESAIVKQYRLASLDDDDLWDVDPWLPSLAASA